MSIYIKTGLSLAFIHEGVCLRNNWFCSIHNCKMIGNNFDTFNMDRILCITLVLNGFLQKFWIDCLLSRRLHLFTIGSNVDTWILNDNFYSLQILWLYLNYIRYLSTIWISVDLSFVSNFFLFVKLLTNGLPTWLDSMKQLEIIWTTSLELCFITFVLIKRI